MRGCRSRPLFAFCSLCVASLALAARLAAAVIPGPPATGFFFFLRFKSTSRANYLFSDLVFLCKGVRTRYEAAGPALASMSGPDGA